MRNISVMKQTLLALSIATASLAITACNSNDDNAVQTNNNSSSTSSAITDAQIQAKQNGGQVAVFAAIKTIQDSLTEEAAGSTFDATVKAKIATNAQSDIATWLSDLYANKDKTAAQNMAGKLARTPKDDGTPRSIVVNAKAAEYGQLVKKGLIGAYQLQNVLTEAGKLRGAGADNAAVLANVTAYLLGDYSELAKGKGEDAYAGNEFEKYLKKVASNENFSTVEDDLYTALNNAKSNLDDNDKFTANIMEALAVAQKTVAVRAVHYLNEGAGLAEGQESTEFAGIAHGVSEGLGLLYSLQYTYNSQTHAPYYTEAEVDEFLGSIDFWNKADAKTKLAAKVAEIAEKFGFDATKA